MKKIILVIVVTALIITAGVIEQVYVQRTFEELEVKAENIYVMLRDKNYTDALEYTANLKDWWYQKRDILELVSPNNDIKEIVREIGELEGSQLAMMYDDSITRSNVLQEMAKNSRNLLAYRWKNVF